VEAYVGIIVLDEEPSGHEVAHCITCIIHWEVFDEQAVAFLAGQSVQVEGTMFLFVKHMGHMDLCLEVEEEVGGSSDAVGGLDGGDLPSSEEVAYVVAYVTGGQGKGVKKE
jgi:hypothetical protein